ncbi:MAG TPA: flagellar hook-associated protein FlgK [Clostridiales bacterium]|nr:flagellar hook-associated protein FlgK [Clostridiales bacterium]
MVFNMGSFGSLSIGVSGLNISQNALNTTAHNLANIDTNGYVRQQVVLKDFGYVKWGENHLTTLQKGLGVDFLAVKQVRDAFLDKAFRQESGREAYYDAQYQAVSEIEGLFGEMEGVAFQDSINSIWVSIQELAKEPDGLVPRASFVQSAVSFIERAENIHKQLKDYQLNLNTKVKDMVGRINEIGEEIKTLNHTIRHYESNGVENANDLRDQRNLLLDELGKLVNITYREDADGMVTVNVEGTTFLTEDKVFYMGVEKANPGSDLLAPVWPSHKGTKVFNFNRVPSSEANTDIGNLKGLLITMGNGHANYTDIPLRLTPEGENSVNDENYKKAVEEYNLRTAPSTITSVQAEFDQLIHGIVTMINDVLCPNKTITVLEGGVPVEIQVLDEDKAPITANGDKGIELFTRKSMERYVYKDVTDEDGNTFKAYVYNEEDVDNNYALYTLGEIEVNPLILEDYANIALSSNSGTGDNDIDAINTLISKWQEPFATLTPHTLTYYNITGYYNAFISGLANRGEQYHSISTNQATMVANIDNKRMEITAVSSDEELTNLIKYQHSYNAAARYVNVIDEMLEHIIMNM